MEAEESKSSINRVLSSSTGSVSVSLHPLVIMNISDHYTRSRMQGGGTSNAQNFACMYNYVQSIMFLFIH